MIQAREYDDLGRGLQTPVAQDLLDALRCRDNQIRDHAIEVVENDSGADGDLTCWVYRYDCTESIHKYT